MTDNPLPPFTPETNGFAVTIIDPDNIQLSGWCLDTDLAGMLVGVAINVALMDGSAFVNADEPDTKTLVLNYGACSVLVRAHAALTADQKTQIKAALPGGQDGNALLAAVMNSNS